MAYNCPHCSKGIDDVIPKARFDDVNNARKTAIETVETLTAKLSQSQESAPELDTLKQQLAELNDQMSKQTTSHDMALTVARAGIMDADDAADLLAIFKRRGGDTPLAEWLGNRADLPRAAAALLPDQSPTPAAVEVAPPTPAAVEVAPPTPAQPPANRGATGHPAGSQTFSSDQISNMSVEEYKANRAAILRSLSGR
tara:strand:- start:440 stop:1033 length:594 start_codon:yes stop_codon:yes gene_type:complete